MSVKLTDEEIKKHLESITCLQKSLYNIGFKYKGYKHDKNARNSFFYASCNYYKWKWRQLAKTKKILKAELKKRRHVYTVLEKTIKILFDV